MAQINIRNVTDSTYWKIKVAAATANKTMRQFVLDCVEKVLEPKHISQK